MREHYMSSAAFLLHIHVGNCLDLLADSTWPLRLLDVYVNRVIPDTTPINDAIAFDEMRVLVRPQRRSPFSLHRHVSTTCVCLGGRPRRVGRDARRHAQGRRARRSGGALRCGAARDGAFAV